MAGSLQTAAGHIVLNIFGSRAGELSYSGVFAPSLAPFTAPLVVSFVLR